MRDLKLEQVLCLTLFLGMLGRWLSLCLQLWFSSWKKEGALSRGGIFLILTCLSGLFQDGLIHTSLKPAEILYLTVAYDWFLFG